MIRVSSYFKSFLREWCSTLVTHRNIWRALKLGPHPGHTADQTTSESGEWEPGMGIFKSSPGDSKVQSSLRTTALRGLIECYNTGMSLDFKTEEN